MRDVVRASALQGFDVLVRELGGDPEPILAAAHLRAGLLGSTDAYIPFRTMARVIDSAAVELRCPDFSFRLSAYQSIEILGPIALIARHSRTSREALLAIAEHLGSYSPALRVGLDPVDAQRSRYTFEVLVAGIPSLTRVHQLGLGVTLGIFRLLMGAEFRPLRVDLPHARPENGDHYERFFGAPVRFDAGYCGMELRNADLDRRRATDDPRVREHVARYLDAEGPADDDFVAQVQHLIGRTLPTGHATTVTVSAHLGLHTRTMQRRLAKEAVTFEGLLDEVRRERARYYLVESSMSFGQIAALLGYSQQSCLTRASNRWFGVSPREVRRDGIAESYLSRPIS